MQRSKRVRRRHTPAQKNTLLVEYRRSGLTQKEFATQAGIGYSTLTYWLRKALSSSKPRKPAFVAVPNLLSPAAAPTYRLRLAGGWSVEVASGFQPEELASLLRVLQRL